MGGEQQKCYCKALDSWEGTMLPKHLDTSRDKSPFDFSELNLGAFM